MRIVALAIPLLMLGACQVSDDDQNGSTTVTYNDQLAENVAADVGAAAENIAGHISNDVSAAGDKVQNEVGDVDVDVDADVKTENSNQQ